MKKKGKKIGRKRVRKRATKPRQKKLAVRQKISKESTSLPTEGFVQTPPVSKPPVLPSPPEPAHLGGEEVKHTCWIEVRPYSTTQPRPRSLESVVDLLHHAGETFRWVAAYSDSPRVEGRKVIRYFLEVPSAYAEHIKNEIGGVGFHAEDSAVPEIPYDLVCVAELARDYSWPLIPASNVRAIGDSIADHIAQALRTGGTIEIIARADQGAARHISMYEHKQRNPQPGTLSMILSPSLAPRAGQVKPRYPEDILRHMRERALGKLFVSEIRMYGSAEKLDPLISLFAAMPSHMNSLRQFRLVKGRRKLLPFDRPSRGELKRFAMYGALAAVGVLGAIYMGLLYAFGIFNPLRLGILNFIIPLPVIAAVLAIHRRLRVKRPVILSSVELSELISPPTNLGNLPLELAKEPTRSILTEG